MNISRMLLTGCTSQIVITVSKSACTSDLIKAIPKPEKATAAQFGPAAEELFNRIMQLTDNAGATDDHRALNYLAMRYPAIYAKAAEAFAQDYSMTSVEVRPSPLSSTRSIVDAPEMCNGLMVPIVAFDQIYSFDRESLIKSIPMPAGARTKKFTAAATELFERIMQMTDNAGATDENRALNYLAIRYPAIYAKAAEEFAANASLSAVEVRPSPLSNTRKVVDVIFSFTNRNTDVTEKFFVRVDVTEEFPFLVTKMSPYYDR